MKDTTMRNRADFGHIACSNLARNSVKFFYFFMACVFLVACDTGSSSPEHSTMEQSPVSTLKAVSQQRAVVEVAAASVVALPSGHFDNVEEEIMFRSSYDECADASAGVTGKILDCIAEEFEYQDARLNLVYRSLKDKLPDAQSHLKKGQKSWLSEIVEKCKWDADTEGQGQLIDAKSCELNMTVLRADELEKMMRSSSSD